MDFLAAKVNEAADHLLGEKVEAVGKALHQPIQLTQVDWNEYWRAVLNVGIYRRGADVAEVGSTWLESLVGMDVLTEFTPQDLRKLGRQDDFFPSVWHSVTAEKDGRVWAIPFRADVRLIFYWKDLFEQGGVDPEQAFTSLETIAPALRQMKNRGVTTPWGAPTAKGDRDLVYSLASWLWAAGGEFIAPATHKVELSSPASYRGLRAYFGLTEFMPDEGQFYTDTELLELFGQRKVAAIIGGPWVPAYLRDHHFSDLHLGAVLPPGPSFVGGTALVTWQHSKTPREAKELVGQLSEANFQKVYSQLAGCLPVRSTSWNAEFLATDPLLPVYLKALETGRGLPPIRLWGMIEDRLAETLGAIWAEIFATSRTRRETELEAILTRQIEPLVTRLEMIMNG